jgi:hypothetical protein
MHRLGAFLPCPLSTDRRAEQHSHTIDHLSAPETPSRTTHALTDCFRIACFRRWEATRATSPTHDGVAACASAAVWIRTDPSLRSASLKGGEWFFPFKEAQFSASVLQRCELIAHVVGHAWRRTFL